MTTHIRFQPFDRALLKSAADETIKAAKAASSACAKALLTEEQSAAESLEGYAEEAKHFIDAPEGDDVQLAFNHRLALRTGCLILVREIGKYQEKGEKLFHMSETEQESTDKREKDFRRLADILRAGENMGDEDTLNAQLDLEDEAKKAAAAKAEEDAKEPVVHEADGITPVLQLGAGTAIDDDAEVFAIDDDDADEDESIPDADFEDVGDADAESSTDDDEDAPIAELHDDDDSAGEWDEPDLNPFRREKKSEDAGDTDEPPSDIAA